MTPITLGLYSANIDKTRETAKKLSLISRKTFGHTDYMRPEHFVLLSQGTDTVLIARIAGDNGPEIAGYCSYTKNDDVLIITSIAVDNNFRNFGVGASLISRIKKRISNKNADVTKARVHFDDSRFGVSGWFIEKHGFRIKKFDNMPTHITSLEFKHAPVHTDNHGFGKH